MLRIIEINSVKGNSGAKANAVYSKPGKMNNYTHMEFAQDKMEPPEPKEEEGFDYEKWKHDVSEMEAKHQLKKVMHKVEGKYRKEDQQDKLLKNGMSKSVPRPG